MTWKSKSICEKVYGNLGWVTLQVLATLRVVVERARTVKKPLPFYMNIVNLLQNTKSLVFNSLNGGEPSRSL